VFHRNEVIVVGGFLTKPQPTSKSTMASSPLPSRTRRKKSDRQLGNNLLSIRNRKICYDGKKAVLNDDEKKKIAAFESALKAMNVTDMSEPEQTSLIKKYNSCYRRLNDDTEPDLTQILAIVNDWAPKTDLILPLRFPRRFGQIQQQSIRWGLECKLQLLGPPLVDFSPENGTRHPSTIVLLNQTAFVLP
jgi:hypothetical protein